jgi:hypothetical protein
MSELTPGTGLLFMKVGRHAQETLEQIIERKSKEIHDVGYSLWGYGGNTCHPGTMVQPFAKAFEKNGQTIKLFMEPMESSHFAEPIRADEYSIDGMNWQEIPAQINVKGSRYALAIKALAKDEFDLPLYRTVVGIGNSTGRPGNLYVKGRVDKACLEVVEHDKVPNQEQKTIHIGLSAELVPPYAVYLRNRR